MRSLATFRPAPDHLDQARGVFLAGCGLPAAWAHAAQWKILETSFGLGLNFLLTWQAWQSDPARPRLLHVVAVQAMPADSADLLRAEAEHPDLMPLACELARQLRGLVPGVHRLVFEQGRVMLTLHMGPVQAMLRGLRLEVDSVFLDGFALKTSADRNPDMGQPHTLKAVARCCRRGTRLATCTVARPVMDGLQACGFEVKKRADIAPKRDWLEAVFNPHWQPKKYGDALTRLSRSPGTCVVIGAGLAGAACAASLARRGWQVEVLDRHPGPAQGASGLPAGLFAPHVSPDDSALSRLSRSGVRATLQQARSLLAEGRDWKAPGVLQRRFDNTSQLPTQWSAESSAHEFRSNPLSPLSPLSPLRPLSPLSPLSRIASKNDLEQLTHALGKNPFAQDAAPALWHPEGGWIRPEKLVRALLAQPGIRLRTSLCVAHLRPGESGWEVMDHDNEVCARADLVVVAAGFESAEMASSVQGAGPQLALQAVRGQVSWGCREDLHAAQTPTGDSLFPLVPVNGHGSFIPAFEHEGRMHWLAGASFERGNHDLQASQADEALNLERLEMLLPGTAAAIRRQSEGRDKVHAWTGIRCASTDRLPLVGPVDEAGLPGLWVCTALGSRGLTFAVLCGELLAAWANAEPLPLERRLAESLLASRPSATRQRVP